MGVLKNRFNEAVLPSARNPCLDNKYEINRAAYPFFIFLHESEV